MDNETYQINKLHLPTRNEIGYEYEFDHMFMMVRHSILFEANPWDYEDWLKNNHVFDGYDMEVYTPKGTKKIEIKKSNYPIHHSWFLKDWLSRPCDVISTNNKWNISHDDRMLLQERGIKLMNDYELLMYLLKLHRHPNKYTIKYSTMLCDKLCSSLHSALEPTLNHPYTKGFCDNLIDCNTRVCTFHPCNINSLNNIGGKIMERTTVKPRTLNQKYNQKIHSYVDRTICNFCKKQLCVGEMAYRSSSNKLYCAECHDTKLFIESHEGDSITDEEVRDFFTLVED